MQEKLLSVGGQLLEERLRLNDYSEDERMLPWRCFFLWCVWDLKAEVPRLRECKWINFKFSFRAFLSCSLRSLLLSRIDMYSLLNCYDFSLS